MEDSAIPNGNKGRVMEGSLTLSVKPSGKGRGPGKREGVFYNPAMVINRDLSIILLQTLLDRDEFGTDGPVRILDGLTGSGIRALRFSRELDPNGRDLKITGIDINPYSVRTAVETASMNGCGDVEFIRDDLNNHTSGRKYHYIDLDPFGSPVPFLHSCLRGLRRGGVLAITATDTAALTGSIPRVARRRYGIDLGRTHFMQEMAARSLLGYTVRTAASFELGATPLYFYSSDHFVRGYVRVGKGAGKVEKVLSMSGYLLYDGFSPPIAAGSLQDISADHGNRVPMGPVWIGPLSDTEFVRGMIKTLENRKFPFLKKRDQILKDLRIAVKEDELPPGGFDLNRTASHLGTSPPGIGKVAKFIEDNGHRWSRSRFSPTVIKTDSPFGSVLEVFGKEKSVI